MRFLWMSVVAMTVAGCGGALAEEEDTIGTVEHGLTPTTKERWCRSYSSQKFCPKHVCQWYTTPAPGYCGLPAES
jgi:hypothetical protein